MAALAVAYLFAELVTRVLSGLVDRVNQRVPGDVTHRRTTRTGLRVVRGIVTFLVGAVLIFPALSLVGIRPGVGLTPERLGDWLTGSGLRIALIALLSWLVIHVVGIVAGGSRRPSAPPRQSTSSSAPSGRARSAPSSRTRST